jgi:acyl-CoA reductase-like NAD-dependent aldehyde dehydrogenase
MPKAKLNTTESRLNIQKTYKIYIGGQFPRTESGRYYKLKSDNGDLLGNICLSSRKDFRNAVGAARGAVKGWAGKSAFNRSQILYRLGEMLEGRSDQFAQELIAQGAAPKQARAEVAASIDRLIYYAGWADKYQQIFSSVNPVASSHFNFTMLEPMGVVAILAPEKSPLLGLVSVIAATIAGGNTCVVLASESTPLCAVTFSEVIHSSDVPAGVVNLLTGRRKELLSQFTMHMDVNALVYSDGDAKTISKIKGDSTSNLKRPIIYKGLDWSSVAAESPYFIYDVQEAKTTWHPIGK